MSHIQTYSELCVTMAYTTVPYSELVTHIELVTFSKGCETCKMMIRHIQNFSIVRTVFSSIFRDIDAYSAIITGGTRRKGEASPTLFWRSKEMPWFWEKLQSVYLRRLFFLCLWQNVCRSALVPQNLSCPEKCCGSAPAIRNYSFCKTLYLKCLTVFWIRLPR